MENQLTSCERVLEYTRLEREESFIGCIEPDCVGCKAPAAAAAPVPPGWPAAGDIEFRNTQLMYTRDSPPVLRGVNCTIKDGQKIGIVGRTGAGKSSLLAALLRIVELEVRRPARRLCLSALFAFE